MHIYDYFSSKSPILQREPYSHNNLLSKQLNKRDLRNYYQQKEFRSSMVRSRSQKDYQLNREILNYREIGGQFSRKSLMEKLDRKLQSIRFNHGNSNHLKSSTASLHRINSAGPFQQPPKRHLVSEPADEERMLLFGEKRGRIKEDIAKSIGRLSRVSRKLYEQRKYEIPHVKKERHEYFNRLGRQKDNYDMIRIDRKPFIQRNNKFEPAQKDKYSRIIKNQQLLEEQLKGFGNYGLYNRSRHRY